ncbi:YceI family protein [Solitalea longa]|uniref:YceI family protein n=1 Tax=Solitalea longa TaxID=2079460 RepID=A0A2S5A287_9SPHI|nr:YceI family protein [Solitalea longa]POY36382.1 YceI family protein [Solitalea longa]
MKIYLLLIATLSMTFHAYGQTLFTSKNLNISFISDTPLESIRAQTTSAIAVLNLEKKEIAFEVPVSSFEFDLPLMHDHFNDLYLESDRFPKATFHGQFNSEIDFMKNGVYPITAEGKLYIKGISKSRTIQGFITINNGMISFSSTFSVNCKDHNIKISKMVSDKIANTIDVSVKGEFSAYLATK